LTRDRTRASAVEGRLLTAWAVARPNHNVLLQRLIALTHFTFDGSSHCAISAHPPSHDIFLPTDKLSHTSQSPLIDTVTHPQVSFTIWRSA
jgi:hypothetical protein